MAFLKGFEFIGKLGGLSAYRMKGTDKIVVRTKGGPTKQQIKNNPAHAGQRRNMSEFGGCSSMGREVRRALGTNKALADFNLSKDINALMKIVQKQDTESVWGERKVMLSKVPRVLEGFSLNERVPFDSIVRHALVSSLSRDTRAARIEVPAMMPGINLFAPHPYPMFRITAVLGVVADFAFNEALKRYDAPDGYMNAFFTNEAFTPWYPVLKGSPATTLEVQETTVPPDAQHSIILSVGIAFGTLYGHDIVEQIEDVGAAKVLAVV